MKQRYTQEITPIEVAYATRTKLAQEQQELLAKDLTIRFNRKASATGLGDYIKNPSMAYLNVSGALLTSLVATLAKSLVSRVRANPQEFKKILGGAYFQIVSRNGYDEKEIAKAMNHVVNPDLDTDADPILTNIVHNVITASGVPTWNDPLAVKDLTLIASTGLMASMGDYKTHELDNKGYDYAMQDYYRKKAIEKPPADKEHPWTYVPKTGVDGKYAAGFDPKQFEADKKLVEKVTNNKDFLDPKIDASGKYKSNYYMGGLNLKPTPNGLNDPSYGARLYAWEQQLKNPVYDETIPTSAGAVANVQRLRGMMKKYGATKVEDLSRLIDETAERTASVRNDYQFELANTDLAMEKLADRINSYWGTNGNTGILTVNSDGSLGGFAKTSELFDKTKGKLTLMHNTDAERLEFVKDGKKYAVDANVIDPSGKTNKILSRLKQINPVLNGVDNQRDFQAGAALHKTDADEMNDKLGALLNEFAKTLSVTTSKPSN